MGIPFPFKQIIEEEVALGSSSFMLICSSRRLNLVVFPLNRLFCIIIAFFPFFRLARHAGIRAAWKARIVELHRKNRCSHRFRMEGVARVLSPMHLYLVFLITLPNENALAERKIALQDKKQQFDVAAAVRKSYMPQPQQMFG